MHSRHTDRCDSNAIAACMREVVDCEAEALKVAAARIQPQAAEAVRLLFECHGRVLVSGMGKMGWIARKATATFCSTGTPAVFLHPSEAAHGDLGIVTPSDLFLVLSNSGETGEILDLLPYMHRLGVPIISLTGNLNSTLAHRSTAVLDIGVTQEADPISLAPTASTTVALAMCDALAIALMQTRGFTRDQFAIFHPGGNLGRKLLLTVTELMHTGDRIPQIFQSDRLRDAIVEISRKGLGAVMVVDVDQQLCGIITDGDLRRVFERKSNPLQDPVSELMTRQPRTITAQALAAEALRLMEEQQITVLPVVDSEQKPIGIVHMHDLVRAGLA